METKSGKSSKRERPEVNWIEREKDIFVFLREWRDAETGKQKLKFGDIAQIPHAPSARTLRRWVSQRRNEKTLIKKKRKKGRKPLLKEVEKRILCGWAVQYIDKGKPLSLERVCAQISTMFGVDGSVGWVSMLMHEIGFSSKRAHETAIPRFGIDPLRTLTSWLCRIREIIADTYTPDRIVCMDVISFRNTGVVLRS
jgi:transposase